MRKAEPRAFAEPSGCGFNQLQTALSCLAPVCGPSGKLGFAVSRAPERLQQHCQEASEAARPLQDDDAGSLTRQTS